MNPNKTQLTSAFGLLTLVSAVYLVVIFPLAYFRHDDWLILGNAIRFLHPDWSRLFDPTLFYIGNEEVWFFRPMFKLFVYVFYSLFGFDYYLWLSALYFFFLAGLWLLSSGIAEATKSRISGTLCLVLIAASVHCHFGSLFWMGEGMMNCPQFFFLALNLYFVVYSFRKKFFLFQFFGYLSFLVALGFKESSVFHALFVGVLLLFDKSYRIPSRERWLGVLAVYGVTTGIYLVYRLFVLPVNPYYVPAFSPYQIGKSAFLIMISLSIPLLVTGAMIWWKSPSSISKGLRAIKSVWPFLAVLSLSIVPYLGHSFFSPGWLLLPLVYFVAILAYALRDFDTSMIPLREIAVALLVVSVIPVGVRVSKLKWWDWKKGQVALKRIVEEAPKEKVRKIVVYDCGAKNSKELGFDRVVGFEAGIHHLWALHHDKEIPVWIEPCNYLNKKIVRRSDVLVLQWNFPELNWINRNKF